MPLSSYGTQKLLVERYPELQTLQTSCHHGDPCNTCPKCRCHQAYLKVMGEDPRNYGYNGKIKKEFKVEELLDIERESQHWALALATSQPSKEYMSQGGWLSPNFYWGDALPYGIPDSEAILSQYFSRGHMGRSFTTYGKYTYDTGAWKRTAKEICNG